MGKNTFLVLLTGLIGLVIAGCQNPASTSAENRATGSPTLAVSLGPQSIGANATVAVTDALVGGSSTTTLTVANSGSATLSITGLSISGTNAGLFSITPASANVGAGSATNLSLKFSPLAVISGATATITINSNAASFAFSVTASGVSSAAPNLAVTSAGAAVTSGATAALGSASIGNTRTLKVGLINKGTANLSVTSLALSGTDAASYATDTTSITLAAGQSATATITFSASGAAGSRSAALTISSNDATNPSFVLNLSATVLGYATTADLLATAADGFAAAGNTTGGNSAGIGAAVTVTTRAQLVSALSGSSAKIILVSGTIDLCVDGSNNSVGASYFASTVSNTGYDFPTYLAAYKPATWGTSSVPSGTQESARSAAATNQRNVVQISVPSNTTILGIGDTAKIINGSLYINGASNIIIRNIEFRDAYDFFPQWDPTDGSTGNWNSAYDLISVKGGTNVWIDHCTFSDGSRTDDLTSLDTAYYSTSSYSDYNSRHYQHHDGAIDITNAADLITVSYCYIHDHDKTHLIGSSASSSATDSGKLRVTFHHNYFVDLIQRVPRVRYGVVHLYNNYFAAQTGTAYAYSYSLGAGVKSSLYVEKNYFDAGTATISWADTSSWATYGNPGVKDVSNNLSLNYGSNTSLNSPAWTPATTSGYTYGTTDAAANAKTLAQTYAGAGKPLR